MRISTYTYHIHTHVDMRRYGLLVCIAKTRFGGIFEVEYARASSYLQPHP